MVKRLLQAIGLLKIAKAVKTSLLYNKRKPYFNRLNRAFGPETSFIANNCFGGRIPQDLDRAYNSPTAGLYICYPDYIIFLRNLKKFASGGVTFRDKSKYQEVNDYLATLPHHVPVGVLNDGCNEVEIIFLHYRTREEALEKWERRCRRINWNNIVVFATDNDGCTRDDAEAFLELPYKQKFFFSAHDWGIADSHEYAFIREFEADGKVNGYEKAHLLYKYLCNNKLKQD